MTPRRCLSAREAGRSARRSARTPRGQPGNSLSESHPASLEQLPPRVVNQTHGPTLGVRRRSALSIRSSSRLLAREVNMLYGSRHPLVVRSSIKIPMYASSRLRTNAGAPGRVRAFSPAMIPCAALLLVSEVAVDLSRQEESRNTGAPRATGSIRRLDESVLTAFPDACISPLRGPATRERGRAAPRRGGSSRSR